jgi:hypothetical protein
VWLSATASVSTALTGGFDLAKQGSIRDGCPSLIFDFV